LTRRHYRTHQYGSLFKRGKKQKVWVGRWYEDRTGPDGFQRIRCSEVIGLVSELSRSQAQQILLGKLERINTGRHQPKSSLVLREFVEQEWEPAVLPTLKHSSQKHYRYVLDTHVLPAFGDHRIGDISREAVQSFLRQKLENGLSLKTVRHLRTALGTIMSRAEQWGYVDENVVRKTLLPRRGPQPEKKALTVEEIRKLISRLPEPSRTLVSLLVRTGLRIGELLALRCKDVDFDGREIRVERTFYEGRFDDPKSRSSRRHVPLSPIAVKLLRLRKPRSAHADDLVFASRVGTPLNRRNLLRRQLHPAAEKLGLFGVGWHSFRHANATLLDAAGTPLGTVQNLLGHASAEVTRGVYLHSVSAEARQAVDKLDRLLAGPKSDPSFRAERRRAVVNH